MILFWDLIHFSYLVIPPIFSRSSNWRPGVWVGLTDHELSIHGLTVLWHNGKIKWSVRVKRASIKIGGIEQSLKSKLSATRFQVIISHRWLELQAVDSFLPPQDSRRLTSLPVTMKPWNQELIILKEYLFFIFVLIYLTWLSIKCVELNRMKRIIWSYGMHWKVIISFICLFIRTLKKKWYYTQVVKSSNNNYQNWVQWLSPCYCLNKNHKIEHFK